MFNYRYYSGDQDRLFSEAHIVSPNKTNSRPTPSKRVSRTSCYGKPYTWAYIFSMIWETCSNEPYSLFLLFSSFFCLCFSSPRTLNYYQYTWPNRKSASSKHTLSGPQKTDNGLLMHYQPYSWLVLASTLWYAYYLYTILHFFSVTNFK